MRNDLYVTAFDLISLDGDLLELNHNYVIGLNPEGTSFSIYEVLEGAPSLGRPFTIANPYEITEIIEGKERDIVPLTQVEKYLLEFRHLKIDEKTRSALGIQQFDVKKASGDAIIYTRIRRMKTPKKQTNYTGNLISDGRKLSEVTANQ